MSDPTNFADAEHRHDCISSDDRPRIAVRNGWSRERYEDAAQDCHRYDTSTGQWS